MKISSFKSSSIVTKTNQFNLTTKRYTEAQIVKMIRLKSHDVIITSLKDIYGDYGLTGLVIIENSKITLENRFSHVELQNYRQEH